MLEIKVVLGNVELEEEKLGLHKRLDYYEIAMTLLYTGTEYQKRCINHMMKHYKGRQRTEEIREFIDVEIMLGKVGV